MAQSTREQDSKKAEVFFGRGKTVGDTGNYDFSVEMYLIGLALDPDNTKAHQALWEVAMKRKATGGADLPMGEKYKLKRPSKDDKQNMLAAAKLLAFDPGNTDHMVTMIESAQRSGYTDTVMWLAPLLLRANADSKKPDFRKFLVVCEIYKELGQWQKAIEAGHYAMRLRPDDMDLQSELKNMAAQETMRVGNYQGSFTESVSDMDGQTELLNQDKDVVNLDYVSRQIAEAEAQYKASPEEPGKLSRLVDALTKTDEVEKESRAIDLLEEAYARSKRYSLRQRIGQINMKQMARMVRTVKAEAEAHPEDKELQKELAQRQKEQYEYELAQYREWAQNYPTDRSHGYEAAKRLFLLKRYDEAIPEFQQSTHDPKYTHKAQLFLGRCFLEAGFVDEAIDVLASLINVYPLRGDDDSREMYYWRARALETRLQTVDALKLYSQLAQWNFNYRDVQARIKKLRTPSGTT